MDGERPPPPTFHPPPEDGEETEPKRDKLVKFFLGKRSFKKKSSHNEREIIRAETADECFKSRPDL